MARKAENYGFTVDTNGKYTFYFMPSDDVNTWKEISAAEFQAQMDRSIPLAVGMNDKIYQYDRETGDLIGASDKDAPPTLDDLPWHAQPINPLPPLDEESD